MLPDYKRWGEIQASRRHEVVLPVGAGDAIGAAVARRIKRRLRYQRGEAANAPPAAAESVPCPG